MSNLFGGLKKSKETGTYRNDYSKYLIVGHDYGALAVYEALREKHGKENVRIISNKDVSIDTLFFPGPNMVRGRANGEFIKYLFPTADLTWNESTPLFYKDSKLRRFGGRTKSHQLLPGEDYFLKSKWSWDPSQLLTPCMRELIQQSEKDYFQRKEILEITKVGPTDLVDPQHFELRCGDYTMLGCEYLYWCEGPSEFLKLFKNKELFTDGQIEFCQSSSTSKGVSVQYEIEEKITEKSETFFLPQSQTHDLGSFMGEFFPFDEQKKRQIFPFFTYISENESAPEQISSKIRSMKRAIERVFPDLKKMKLSENVWVHEEIPCLNFDDKKFYEEANKNKELLSKLSFVHASAPIDDSELPEVNFEYSLREISGPTRMLLSLAQLKKNENKNR